MEWWVALLQEGTGWVVAGVEAVIIGRTVLKGDLVLGREYQYVVKELDEISARFETLTAEQRDQAAEERRALMDRIEAQSRRLDAFQAAMKDREVSS